MAVLLRMLILLFVLALVRIGLGAKILAFFPIPVKSHNNLFKPIVEGLADRGHEIVYYTPILIPKPHPNITQIDVQFDLKKLLGHINLVEYGQKWTPTAAYELANMVYAMGEEIYQLPEVQELIHSDEKFDLILFETTFFQEASATLMHKFNVPAVDINPFGEHAYSNELSGLPDNPSYMIDFRSLYSDDMNFLERLHNTFNTLSSTLIGYYFQMKFQGQMDRYFNYSGWETRPPLNKLMSDKALILVSNHFSTSYPYPKAPHVKDIGGIHLQPNKPLPKDIQTFMDEAKDGVIYFSFGSNLNMTELSTQYLQGRLMKVFSSLKQRVLWKWSSDTFPELPPNIKMSSWFPQQDILAHKNVKLFITHGGYLSISESINYGVPLIGVPFFGDQPKNMVQVEAKGYGINMALDNITEASMKWAINEVLSNPKYKENAKKVSALFNDRQMTPLEEAIYWIEYVLRHGKVLQPQSTRLSFCAYHLLDVIGTFLIILCLSLLVVLRSIKCLVSMCTGRKAKTNKKSKKD